MINTKIVVSKDTRELLITVLLAAICVQVYKSSPLLVTLAALGMTVAIPIFLKKPEFAIFVLVAVLPFRDIHLVSIIHVKRLVIWGLFLYTLIQQLTKGQKRISRSLVFFNKTMAFFIVAIIVSLLQTSSELHSNPYITVRMLKSTILSDALVVIEEMLIVYIIFYSLQSLNCFF